MKESNKLNSNLMNKVGYLDLYFRLSEQYKSVSNVWPADRLAKLMDEINDCVRVLNKLANE